MTLSLIIAYVFPFFIFQDGIFLCFYWYNPVCRPLPEKPHTFDSARIIRHPAEESRSVQPTAVLFTVPSPYPCFPSTLSRSEIEYQHNNVAASCPSNPYFNELDSGHSVLLRPFNFHPFTTYDTKCKLKFNPCLIGVDVKTRPVYCNLSKFRGNCLSGTVCQAITDGRVIRTIKFRYFYWWGVCGRMPVVILGIVLLFPCTDEGD